MRDLSASASVLRRRVAANVRRLRLAAGMTLAVTTERADLDLKHWEKIEAGEHNLTIGTLAKLATGRLRRHDPPQSAGPGTELPWHKAPSA